MEYWEMDIGKVNELNFFNKEVEKFASRWSQSLAYAGSFSYLKQKTF